MATFNTQVADALLKTVYQDPLFDSVVLFSRVIDLFEQNSNVQEGPQGKFVQLAHMFGYNEGVGSRSEDGFLPVPGNPTFVNGRVTLKKTLAVAQMTRNIMANAVKSRAAFADWAEVELTKTERGLRADLDRQVIGFGMAALCRVDGSPVAGSSGTVPIDAPYGLPSDTKGWLPGIRRGMRIVAGPDLDSATLRAGGASAVVLTVSKSANGGGGQLTCDNVPSAWADNDYIFRGDDLGNNAPESGVEVEMQGLLGMVDDGTVLETFQNISRTSFDEWKAQVVDASASPYSGAADETLFMRMADDADELGGGMVDVLATSLAAFRNAYIQLRTDHAGFGTGPAGGKKKGGHKGIAFDLGDRTVELRALPKMPPGRVFALTTATLYRYHLSGFEWDDTTGSIWKQVAVGQGIKDAWYAYGRTEMECGCSDPQQNAVATGLSETLS